MSGSAIGLAVGLVAFGYLVGALSPSVFLGRWLQGVDLREHGSGNAGTTNAFRVLGSQVGLAVLLADIIKGVVPVVLARYLSTPLVTVLVAFACVLGHNYSVFLRGRGGKGVATGAGAAMAMVPIPLGILLGLFGVLLLSVRIVSIASITCTVLLPVLAVLFKEPLPYIVACFLMAIIVLWAHRSNMGRLWRGEEPRIKLPRRLSGQPGDEQPAAAKSRARGGGRK